MPMICPTATDCPSLTAGLVSMWQYRVTTPPACPMSTYQPQPGVAGDPSTSQPWLAGTMLHRTTVTTPAAAALMGVPRAAPRSTPLCVGRSAVLNPDTIGAITGWVHGPAAPQFNTSAPDGSTRPATVLTSRVASGSCLAYASGKALCCTCWAASVSVICCQLATVSSLS